MLGSAALALAPLGTIRSTAPSTAVELCEQPSEVRLSRSLGLVGSLPRALLTAIEHVDRNVQRRSTNLARTFVQSAEPDLRFTWRTLRPCSPKRETALFAHRGPPSAIASAGES
jgi:hypothetical protein